MIGIWHVDAVQNPLLMACDVLEYACVPCIGHSAREKVMEAKYRQKLPYLCGFWCQPKYVKQIVN